MSTKAVVELAEKVKKEYLYGDVEYFAEKIDEHRRVIGALCDTVRDQERENERLNNRIAALQQQNFDLVEKVLGKTEPH